MMEKKRIGEFKVFRYLALFFVIGLGLATIIATGGGGGGGSGAGKGSLSLSLLDATTDEYNAVYVTIEEVQAHKAGGTWQEVLSPQKTYNLLELVNGVREELGISRLETGEYTQLRMIIGETPDDGINILSESHPYANYLIDKSNDYRELKVPSGYHTGIKIVHGFEINKNQTTELILDFDASKSIVKAGNSGRWLLKPIIKVLNTDNYSIIDGTVFDADTGNAMGGVFVSAQISDSVAIDPKDRVVIQASTITDDSGSYIIFLQPGTYNIVAYKDEFNPDCTCLVAEPDITYSEDLTLNSALTGIVSGEVSITEGSEEQHVTLSFRQTLQCCGSDEEIEVKSLNVVNLGNYIQLLPEGNYVAVASTAEESTQEHNISISQVLDTTLDINF